ncbi:hypothetical protein Acr_07g0008470 [Actinidia rufa]|uniref:Uncharacterized protein n=1 Tax=Actinidia rufa TaxID=165716 RepID=A0A7J0EW89_9ERIC|nr:hypothetical protein Acr_07g0008470 [Actinidia rufa]
MYHIPFTLEIEGMDPLKKFTPPKFTLYDGKSNPRLTLGEKFWEDLILNPPSNLWYLMSRVKIFARMEDDVWQAERATGSSLQGDGSFKKRRKSSTDHEDRDGHLKEYVDLEKTQEEKVEIRPNPKFDDTLEKDLPWELFI